MGPLLLKIHFVFFHELLTQNRGKIYKKVSFCTEISVGVLAILSCTGHRNLYVLYSNPQSWPDIFYLRSKLFRAMIRTGATSTLSNLKTEVRMRGLFTA